MSTLPISRLSPAQKQQVQSVLQGETEAVASLEAIEVKLAETRMCPRCDTPGAVSCGMARGYDAISVRPATGPSMLQPALLYRVFTRRNGGSAMENALPMV